MHSIPNFFALDFGENFMKIGPKIAKVTDVYIHIVTQIFMSKSKSQYNLLQL